MPFFLALYFIVSFLALGLALYPLLKKAFPEKDPSAAAAADTTVVASVVKK